MYYGGSTIAPTVVLHNSGDVYPMFETGIF